MAISTRVDYFKISRAQPEEQNIEVDNSDHLFNFETGKFIYILHMKIIQSIVLNVSFITTVYNEDTSVSIFYS